MIIPPSNIPNPAKIYALIGSPVLHSLSPLIHNTAFKFLGIKAVYQVIESRDLSESLQFLRNQDIQGFNVTIPYKESVIRFLDEISDEARIIGAVNTVVVKNGRWAGYNTDAAGFAVTLASYKKDIAKKSILLLGAGGSARAVLYALLLDYEPAEIFIYNRTKEHALKMIREFASLKPGNKLNFVSKNEIADLDVKLVVNATPVGLNFNESLLSYDFFKNGMIAYDLIYNPAETEFLRLARISGAEVINGLEMLIAQAAAAFELWTEQPMPVDEVRKKLTLKS